MEGTNNDTDLEIIYHSEASTGKKRKREGKLRSIVWEHFTKLVKEDGSSEKCQCNHCLKFFTCSNRSGTTHLLRHITDGICPVFSKDKGKSTVAPRYMRAGMGNRNGLVRSKLEERLGRSCNQQCMDVEIEPLSERLVDPELPAFKAVEDDYRDVLPLREKLPHRSVLKSHSRGETWVNEFRGCISKLLELLNGRVPVGSLEALVVNNHDYSISAALKCLSEMEDIPQSSEMYLDAVEILQEAGERECFVCLPPEPRRRWLQRILHRHHPMRYSSQL